MSKNMDQLSADGSSNSNMPQELSPDPFLHEPIVDHEVNSASRILHFQENPEVFVKEMDPVWISKNIAKKRRIESMPEFLERVATRGQAVQREFTEKTGIKAPRSQLIVSKNAEGEDVLYRISRRVHGITIEDAIRSGEVADGEIETLIVSVFDYYKAKLASGEDFMWDTHWVEQYRYGHVAGETEDSIYLADTDPMYGEGWKANDDPRTGYAEIEQTTACVLDMIDQFAEIKEFGFMPQLRADVQSSLRENGIHEN